MALSTMSAASTRPLLDAAVWTSVERAHLRATATNAFESLLHAVKLLGPDGTMLDGASPRKRARQQCTRLVLPGDVNDVAAFYLDAIESPAAYCDQLKYDDTELLHVLKPRTVDAPQRFMCLRWCRVAAPLFCHSRDVCVVETMDAFVDERGRRGWALCFHSVEHPSCPDFKTRHNLVRSTVTHSGYVALESDTPGVVDFYALLDWDFRGQLPHWTRKLALAKRLQATEKLSQHMQRRCVESHQRQVRRPLVSPIKPAAHHRGSVAHRLARMTTTSFQSSHLTISTSPSTTMCPLLDDDDDDEHDDDGQLVDLGGMLDPFHVPATCGLCHHALHNAKYYPCQTCDQTVCANCARPWGGVTALNELQMNLKVCLSCDDESQATPHRRGHRTTIQRQRTSLREAVAAQKQHASSSDLLDLSYLAYSMKIDAANRATITE
ncbi:Aste57867_487 [Aphanomyces stellatus]|uniref:Aste57867_487 protein n=1 Tax=Aphanomyces stellatus TaxID=120398 RepID=A0A485K2R7_9STRA|nr:hypothetical protein As57867_000486 [Aphanomyces stellatus]VFT77712.1 Aste57867_487 [Aphanomyces stellatus]